MASCKETATPLDTLTQEKSRAITLPRYPSHVILLFHSTFLFLPANTAVFQIRQHLRQMRGKKGLGETL